MKRPSLESIAKFADTASIIVSATALVVKVITLFSRKRTT